MARIRQDCVQKPSPQSTTPPTYVPSNGSRRPVARGESFAGIAGALGIHPWALIYFNFPAVGEKPTKKAMREVNWYLQEHLGCREVTRDQKNYIFHEGMTRPYIYVPISIADFEGGTEFTATMPSDAWFGFGMKRAEYLGQMFAVEVKEEHQGALVSFDHYQDWFACSIAGKRYGANLAATPSTVGLVAYVATGLQTPRLLNDHEISGVDFSLQLGPLSKGLKAASTTWKLGKVGAKAVKLALTFAEWEKTREVFKQVISNLDIDLHSASPKLHVIDLPLSLGLDASLYYLKAKLKVDYVNITVGRKIEVSEGEDVVAVP